MVLLEAGFLCTSDKQNWVMVVIHDTPKLEKLRRTGSRLFSKETTVVYRDKEVEMFHDQIINKNENIIENPQNKAV